MVLWLLLDVSGNRRVMTMLDGAEAAAIGFGDATDFRGAPNDGGG